MIAKNKASKPREKAYTGKAPFTLAGFIMVSSKALGVREHSRMFIWTFMVLENEARNEYILDSRYH
jgi:hypothetical protein